MSSFEEVPAGRPLRHRQFVGGCWEELGELQFTFLVKEGLRPEHVFLDVGCGSLRGGVHFVRYLDRCHYFGLDSNEELLDAGRRELEEVGLDPGAATLVRDDAFRFDRFGARFDLALAHSVFTHLPLNAIMRCLGELERVLVPGARFFATFFPSAGPRLGTDSFRPYPSITTHVDRDPYHYDPDVFRWAVEGSTLACELVGEWGHPRGQQMLRFTKDGSLPRLQRSSSLRQTSRSEAFGEVRISARGVPSRANRPCARKP